MVRSIQNNEPMELVYKGPNRRIVVQFPQGLDGNAVFSSQDQFLEDAMKTVGIPIPPSERDKYPELQNNPERRVIYLTDHSFGTAFYEIHFKRNMNPNRFSWKPIS